MNSMAKKLFAIAAAVLLVTGIAYGMSINGQLVKAMFENLSSDPTPYLGRVYYNTTSNTVKIYNGTSWTEIGSGTGGGAASNLIENGNAETASVPAGWVTFDDGAVATPVDGTGGTASVVTNFARTTTAGELIDQTGSYKLVKSAANGQGEGWSYDFSLKTKSQLYSQLVSLSFDYYFSSASADSVVVYLYDKDAATLITPRFTTCGGGSTPALAAQTTACHAQLAWVSTTSDDYRLIFMVAGTGTSAWNLFFDNIYTGQHISAVGAAVGGWESYTPTGSWTTNTTYVGRKRRVADSMEYEVSVQLSGAPNAVALAISQPSGETIDSSKIVDTSRGRLGEITVFDADGANQGRLLGEIVYGNTGSSDVYVVDDASGSSHYVVAVNATTPVTFANGDRVIIKYKAPISQFAGTQVSFGDNNVEYAYNSSTTDASDTTSFAYGPDGAQFGNLTASRLKRVRFLTPISLTDRLDLEIFNLGQWRPLQGAFSVIREYDIQNTATYGMQITPVSGSTTDIDIAFGQYRRSTGTTFGSAGDDYSAIDADPAFKWRVVKHKAGIPVGFGIADATNSGLVSAAAQTFGAVKTFADGLKLDDDANQDTLNYNRVDTDTAIQYYWSNTIGTTTEAAGSADATLRYSRTGDNVCILVGAKQDDPTTAYSFLWATIPSWVTPLSNTREVSCRIHSGTSNEVGRCIVTSTGQFALGRNSGTLDGASSGFSDNVSFCYSITGP